MDSNSNQQHLFTTTSFDLQLSTVNNKQQSIQQNDRQQSKEVGRLNLFANTTKLKKNSQHQDLTPKTLSSCQEFLPTMNSLPTITKVVQNHQNNKRYLFEDSNSSQGTNLYSQIFQKALNEEPQQIKESKINPTIGISILDKEGNFIWADSKTQCLFGTKIDSKSITKNIFKSMISFSKFHLFKRFMGQSILQGRNSIRFKYLIYSLDCKNKFIKKLKRQGLKDIHLNKSNKFYRQQVLYKYLKVLVSEAIKVDLRIPKEAILSKQYSQKYDFKFDENFEQNIFYDLQQGKNIIDGDYVFRGVLLRTRLAQSYPDYDYQLLQKDQKIQKFDEQVKKSIGLIQF